METTRKYPRSTSEAFPDVRAEWFEHEPNPVPIWRNIILAVTAVASGVAVAIWLLVRFS